MSVRSAEALQQYLRRLCDQAVLPEDDLLLKRFVADNDREAFEQLIARHGPMVLGTARRLVDDSHDAEDVFQAVFLSLARLAKTIRQGRTLPAWLHKTTCRIAAQARKNRAVQSKASLPEPFERHEPSAELAWQEVRQALDEELQRLPARLRSPLLLCYLSGLTRDEAARQLGWSLGTLKRRLEEGRTALRRRLERRGISAAGLALTVLSPSSLNAAVTHSLVESCLTVVFGKEIGAGGAALALATAITVKGVAMKAAIVSLALVALSVGIYAGLGGAEAPKLIEEKKVAEPKAEAQKLESPDEPLPAGSTMRLGTSRFRHGAGIASMVVSPDRKTAVATNAPDWLGAIRAFDLASGRSLFTIKDLTWADAVAFSPDGRTLVTKYYHILSVRDSATGTELRTINLPQSDPRTITNWLVFTPDGKTIAAASKEKVVHLIDFASGKSIRDFQHNNLIFAVAISPDGKLMAAGGSESENGGYFARLWEIDTGKELRRFMTGPSGIRALAFSPDGKTVAGGGDDARLRLWDVETGKERRAFPSDGDRIRSVAFAPDGTIVAAAGDSLRLYDPASGNERLRIGRKASHLHFTDEGKTLTAAVDGAIYRWDAATGKPLTPDSAGDSCVEQILVTSDGSRIITRGQEGDAHMWDGATGKHLRAVKVGRQRGMAVSPDGKNLVWLVDDAVKSSTPQSLTITKGARLRLYDMTADRFVERFSAFKGDAKDVAFAAAGKTLVTVDHPAGMVRLWNVETGKEKRSFQAIAEEDKNGENYRGVRQAALSPDGKTLATAHYPGESFLATVVPVAIRLWDVESGAELHELSGHFNGVLDMAFSADGRLLATAGERTEDHGKEGRLNVTNQVFIWNVAAGKRAAALPDGLRIGVCCIAFSPDGRSLATASPEGLVQIWETATWTVRTQYRGHLDRPTTLAFTSSGQLLSGSRDTTVLAWDTSPPRGDASVTLESAWTDLAKQNASIAFKSQGRFVSAPSEAVKLFAEMIKPAPDNAKRIQQSIVDLDSPRFAMRENASKTLSDLGEQAKPYLEESAKAAKSADALDRIRKILDHPKEITITPEQLRQIRAVMVLELINDETSKNLLKQWAGGFKGDLLTEEAGAALKRLASGANVNR